MNGEYDLKVVWVNDMTDDRHEHIRSANRCNLANMYSLACTKCAVNRDMVLLYTQLAGMFMTVNSISFPSLSLYTCIFRAPYTSIYIHVAAWQLCEVSVYTALYI